MGVIEFLSEPIWQRLGLTLLHFLWQALTVAVLIAAVVHLFKLRRGNVRYLSYLAAFVIMTVCPVVTFVILGPAVRPRIASPITEARIEEPYVAVPYTTVATVDTAPAVDASPVVGTAPAGEIVIEEVEGLAAATRRVALRERALAYLHKSLPWAMMVWMAGVFGLSLRLLAGFVGVYRWRRRLEVLPERLRERVAVLSKRLGMRKFSRVFVSPSALQAIAVGYLQPMVLLPASMMTQMSPEMLEAVIAHELAHIRRFDLWVNLLQRIAETLLFYHPALWWLSNRLRSERELCCDELAVKATGKHLAYASALENAARVKARRPVVAVALGQDRKPILGRVRHILGLGPAEQNSRSWLAGLVAVLCLATITVLVAFPLAARRRDVVQIRRGVIQLGFSADEIKTVTVEHGHEPPGSEFTFVHDVNRVGRQAFLEEIHGTWLAEKPVQGLAWGIGVTDPLLRIVLLDGTTLEINTARISEPRFLILRKRGHIYFDSPALEALIDKIIIDGLRNELVGSEWTKRKYHAASQLFDLGDKKGVPILVQSMDKDRPLWARVKAAGRLAKDQNPEAFSALGELGVTANNGNFGHRLFTALVLYKDTKYDPVPILKEIGIKDKWPQCGRWVIHSLSEIGNHAAIEAMIDLWGKGEHYSYYLLKTCGRHFELDEREKCLQWWQENKHRPVMELLGDGVESDPDGDGVNQMRRLDPNKTLAELIRRVPDAQGDGLEYITDALIELTGKDFGNDRQAWLRWWRAEQKKLGKVIEGAGETAALANGAAVEKDGYSISGRLLDKPGGKGVGGVTVGLPWEAGSAKTAGDGTYSITGVAPLYGDSYWLTPGHRKGVWTDWVMVDVKDSDVTDKEVYTTLPQSISGTARDAKTGEPIAGARIGISTQSGNRDEIGTDAQGKYLLYIRPREVTFTCEGAPGYCVLDENGKEVNRLEKKIAVSAGERIENVDFKLKLSSIFSGRVVYPDGRPASDVLIDAWVNWKYRGGYRRPGGRGRHRPSGGKRFRLTTDGQGKFVGGMLVNGRIPGTLSPSTPKEEGSVVTGLNGFAVLGDQSMGTGFKASPIPGTHSFKPLKIVLAKTGSATFQVVDANGQLVADADVRFSGGEPISLQSLGRGSYLAKNLIPGVAYNIDAYPPGYYPDFGDKIGFTVEPGQQIDSGTLKLGAYGTKAVLGLINELESFDRYAREKACKQLARLGPEATEAIPALIELLRSDPKNTVRYNAAGALGSIGSAAREAVEDLIWALENDDGGGVKREATIALIKIGDPVELGAMEALRKHGVDPLAGCLAWHPEPRFRLSKSLRIRAAKTLGRIGPGAERAIHQLKRSLLKDPEGQVRAAMARALGLIGEPSALPHLREKLQDEDGSVRKAAAEAIRRIENPGVRSEQKIDAKEVEFEVVDSEATTSSKFTVTLANGVTVELVGVCELPSEGKQWWRPDGSLMKNAPPIEDRGISTTRGSDRLARKFAVKLTKLPEGFSDNFADNFKYEIIPCYDHGRSGPVFKNGKPLSNICLISGSIPSENTHCTLRLLISNDEWIEFKNVSLKANFKTDVEVEVGKQAMEVEAGEDEVRSVADDAGYEGWLTYVDEKRHFRFMYPRTWKVAARDRPVFASHYHDLFVTLNSTGRDNLWVTTENKSFIGEYSDRTTADQLTQGCVYMDVGQQEGPGGINRFGPGVTEMESDNLGDVLARTPEEESSDNRLTRRKLYFHKWGRGWNINVYSRKPVSAENRETIDKVLRSFRFYGVPAGDEIWAMGEARKHLPPEADPDSFVREGGNVYRHAGAKRKGDEVYVTFTKADPEKEGEEKTWEFKVAASGEVIPIGLPSPDSRRSLVGEELLRQAKKASVEHKRAEAIELYKKAVELVPDNVEANLNLAWLLYMYKDGQYAYGKTIISPTPVNETARYFEKVLELDPNNGSAMAGLGNIAHENGDIDKAIELYEKNIEVSGDAADAPMHRLGRIYRRKGEYETALKYFDMFLKIHPDAENIKIKRQKCLEEFQKSTGQIGGVEKILLDVPYEACKATLKFNGVDNFLEVTDSSQLDIGNAFTAELWIKARGVTGEDAIFSKEVPWKSGWTLIVVPQGRGRGGIKEPKSYALTFAVGDGNRFHNLTSLPCIEKDKWHHVAATWAKGKGTIHVDGQFICSREFPPVAPARVPLRIGKASANLGRHFNGELADIRLWNSVRSIKETNKKKNRRLSGKESDLAACWVSPPNSDGIVRDISPNGNDGRIIDSISVSNVNLKSMWTGIPGGWGRKHLWEQVSAYLKTEIKRDYPEANISMTDLSTREGKQIKNGQLHISYRTKEYIVERPAGKSKMAGMVSRRETGPQPDGLVMRIWLSGEVDQLVRPQTLDRTYWHLYATQIYLPEIKLYLKANISYGNKTDKTLLQKYRDLAGWLENVVTDKLLGVKPVVPVKGEESDRWGQGGDVLANVQEMGKLFKDWLDAFDANDHGQAKKLQHPEMMDTLERNLQVTGRLLEIRPMEQLSLQAVLWFNQGAHLGTWAKNEKQIVIGSTLKKHNGKWYIANVSGVPFEQFQDFITETREKHPAANVWLANPDLKATSVKEEVIPAATPIKSLVDNVLQRKDKALRQKSIDKIQQMLSPESTAEDKRSGLATLRRCLTAKFDRDAFRPLVIALLKSEDSQMRALALECLPSLNAVAGDLQRIAPMAKDSSSFVRQHVGGALISIGKGEHGDIVIPALTTLLEDSDSKVIERTLRSMWGQYSSPEFDKLLIKLSNNQQHRGHAIYHCLSTMKSKSPAVCERLVKELDDPDWNNSGRAAWGLTYGVTEEAKPIVEAGLLKTLPEETNDYTRSKEFKALGKVATEKSRSYLQSVIDSDTETEKFKKIARNILQELDAAVEDNGAEPDGWVTKWQGKTPMVADMPGGAVLVGSPKEENGQLRISINDTFYDGTKSRIIVIDNKGRIHTGTQTSKIVPEKEYRTTDVTFADISLKDVKEFQFQIKPQGVSIDLSTDWNEFDSGETIQLHVTVTSESNKAVLITQSEYGFRLIVDGSEYLWRHKYMDVHPAYMRMNKGDVSTVLITIDKDEWCSAKDGRKYLELNPGRHRIQAIAIPHPSSEFKERIYSNTIGLRIKSNKPEVEVEEKKVLPVGDYALEFDGVDDFLEIHASKSLQLGRHFTVQMWIKPQFPDTSIPDVERNLLSKGGYILGAPDEKGNRRADTYGFGFKLIPKDQSRFIFDVGMAGQKGILSTPLMLPKSSDWMHFAVVFDGQKGRIYPGITFELTEESYEPAPNSNIIIGSKFLIPTGNPFKGQIAELRIWNRALSFDEIAEFETMSLDGSEPNLVACWPFEQAEGQRATDISPHNNYARLGSTLAEDNSDPTWIRISNNSENAVKPAVSVGRAQNFLPDEVSGDKSVSVRTGVKTVVEIGAGRYGGGSGTEEDPYQIRTAKQMNEIGTNQGDWDKCFILMDDIDLGIYKGDEFNIIGIGKHSDGKYNKPFLGTFDGNGHKILNFTYSSADRSIVGLFSYIGRRRSERQATIKNLGMISPRINADDAEEAGSLVGRMISGKIKNCYVEDARITGRSMIGGLVGHNLTGTISDCYVSGNISGNVWVGGLAAVTMPEGAIVNCCVIADVKGEKTVGGLISEIQGTITNSYSAGSVKGKAEVGGFAGRVNKGSISNCYTTSNVEGRYKTGGLIGTIFGNKRIGTIYANSFISNCYSAGKVTGVNRTGGLAGVVVRGTIENCYWDIETSGLTRLSSDEKKYPGCRGLTTDKMKQQATYAEWDFTEVWDIKEHHSLPYLRSQQKSHQPEIKPAVQEDLLVGLWRRTRSVYSDDNQEGTELMVLNADRTWLHGMYLGRDEIPTQFWNIVRGPRWTVQAGHLAQYHPPPKGGGEHLWNGKILSVTPTTLAFENMRRRQPDVYTRVHGQTEAQIRKLLTKTDK